MSNDFFEDAPGIKGAIFFSITAHHYYRSIIIDLAALFVKSKSHRANFHLLLSNEFNQFINPETKEHLINTLSDKAELINSIRRVRDTEYAHYDLKDDSPKISLNFDLEQTVRELFSVSRQIIDALIIPRSSAANCINISIAS